MPFIEWSQGAWTEWNLLTQSVWVVRDDLAANLAQMVSFVLDILTEMIQRVLLPALGPIESLLGTVKRLARSIVGGIIDWIPNFADNVRRVANKIIGAFSGTIQNLFLKLPSILARMLEMIVGGLAGVTAKIDDIIGWIAPLTRQGVQAGLELLGRAPAEITNWLVNFAKDGFDYLSRAVEGVHRWIQSDGMNLTNLVYSISGETWEWIKNNAQLLVETIKTTASNAWTWIIDTGMKLKDKVEWIWDSIKQWYDDHLKWIVDRLKPWLEKVNAGLTLTNNIILLKQAIASGKIERVFRSIIEIMTTTMADLADAFNVKILETISEISASVIQTVNNAITPISNLLDTVQTQVFRFARWIPNQLMDNFQNITRWFDTTTQPIYNFVRGVERETSIALWRIRARYRIRQLENLHPLSLSTSQFHEQLQMWQFLIGRIIASH